MKFLPTTIMKTMLEEVGNRHIWTPDKVSKLVGADRMFVDSITSYKGNFWGDIAESGSEASATLRGYLTGLGRTYADALAFRWTLRSIRTYVDKVTEGKPPDHPYRAWYSEKTKETGDALSNCAAAVLFLVTHDFPPHDFEDRIPNNFKTSIDAPKYAAFLEDLQRDEEVRVFTSFCETAREAVDSFSVPRIWAPPLTTHFERQGTKTFLDVAEASYRKARAKGE